jgi:hypothetical protein
MNAKGKFRIAFSESGAQGSFSEENRALLADAILQVIEHSKFSVLELHVVMSADDVEDMLDGIERAGIELKVEDAIPSHELN